MIAPVVAVIVIGAFTFTLVATGLVRRHALRVNLLDVPTDRSSHVEPTPRGGGLPIAMLWVLGLPLLAWSAFLPWRAAIAMAGGGALVAGVGWFDDHGHIHPWIRLLFHLAAGAFTVGVLGGVNETVLGQYRLPLGAMGSVLAVLGLAWMTNLYNFMDGIDGIAGVEALTAGLGMAVLLWAAGGQGFALTPLLLAGSATGFLFWNWPPARIFMGDVGSGLLGFGFGAIAIAGELLHHLPVAVALLPLSVFILDATGTLLVRLSRGERFYQAHRSHVYQRLLRAGWSARSICLVLAFMNFVLSGTAFVGLRHPRLAVPVALAVLSAVVATGIALLVWPRSQVD